MAKVTKLFLSWDRVRLARSLLTECVRLAPPKQFMPRDHRGRRSLLEESARTPVWARRLLQDLRVLPLVRLRAAFRALQWVLASLHAEIRRKEAEDRTTDLDRFLDA